jgi:hypothetical protein
MLVYRESMSAVTRIVPRGAACPEILFLNSKEFLTKAGKVAGYCDSKRVINLAVK